MKALGLVVSEKKIFFYVFSHSSNTLESIDISLLLSVTYRHETGKHYNRVFIFGGKNRFCHTLATKSCLQTFCTGYQTDNIVH